MKLLFSLLTLVMINTECDNNKSDDAKAAVNSEQFKIMQDTTTISYEETTRGFYVKIWISKDSVFITNDRNHKEKVSIPTPKKEWNELMSLLEEIDIQNLPNLEAPTSMRHYDGARFAKLTVTQNRQEINTESFDHGHPPKPIEPLVNKVLSMMEMVKKR